MTTTGATRTRFVVRYSVAVYYILAMVLGGGIVYLVVHGILPSVLTLGAALSAAIAGLIMTAVEDGRKGLNLMLRRLLIWRVGIGYWLFAFFFLAIAVLLGSMVNPLFNGDPLSLSKMKPTVEIVPMFIIFFIVAGLGEELGWTGFLIPRLQTHYGALTSSLIRAILWGTWHLPLLLYSRLDLPSLVDFPYAGWITQKGFLVAMAAFTLMFLIPWSILLSWMFNATKGSLLLVAVLHGSEIWAAYWMLRNGISPRNLDNYWGYGALMIGTAILIVLTTGAQDLSRKHRKIIHQPSFEQDMH